MFKKPPELLKIECNTTAKDPRFDGPSGKTFNVLCPKDCSKIEH